MDRNPNRMNPKIPVDLYAPKRKVEMLMEARAGKVVHREVHRAAHRVEMVRVETYIQIAGTVLEE